MTYSPVQTIYHIIKQAWTYLKELKITSTITELEINDRSKSKKFPLHLTIQNNPWVKEGIIKYIKLTENKKSNQNLCHKTQKSHHYVIIQEKWKHTCIKTCRQTHTEVLLGIVANWKQLQMLMIYKWINTLVHSCNGILFGNKKQWTTDTYKNTDGNQKHHAMWKK